jgi:hypothetical protein
VSSRHNRRKRRGQMGALENEVPVLVERIRQEQQDDNNAGKSYEEANWARLSPVFRSTHNRLRQARGLEPIPPPKVDLYKPPPRILKPFDPTDPEFLAASREFLGHSLILPGGEGFEIKKV